MSLKKGKCDCWRKIGECLAEIDPEKCGARNPEGYCLSIVVDTDPGEDFKKAMPEFCREMRFGN